MGGSPRRSSRNFCKSARWKAAWHFIVLKGVSLGGVGSGVVLEVQCKMGIVKQDGDW